MCINRGIRVDVLRISWCSAGAPETVLCKWHSSAEGVNVSIQRVIFAFIFVCIALQLPLSRLNPFYCSGFACLWRDSVNKRYRFKRKISTMPSTSLRIQEIRSRATYLMLFAPPCRKWTWTTSSRYETGTEIDSENLPSTGLYIHIKITLDEKLVSCE